MSGTVLPMISLYVARAMAMEVAGSVMVATGLALALFQDASGTLPEGTASSVVQIAATALATGGVGYLIAKGALSEWAKTRDAQRALDAEERQREREERAQDRADAQAALARYFEQGQRMEAYYIAQIEAWQARCDRERERSDNLIIQFVERQRVSVGEPERDRK